MLTTKQLVVALNEKAKERARKRARIMAKLVRKEPYTRAELERVC